MYEFETPTPVRLSVRSGAGRVTVQADDVSTTTVEFVAMRDSDDEDRAIDNATVHHTGDTVSVEVGRTKGGFFKGRPQIGVTVVVPRDSDATVETDSADILTQGRLGALSVSTGSGDVTVDTAREMELKTGSGDIEIVGCEDHLRATTGSGDIEIKRAGAGNQLSTGSGDIEVDTLEGDLRAKTGSGDITVKASDGHLDAKTGSGDVAVRAGASGTITVAGASGDVTVGVVPGTAVWVDLNTVTGDVRNRLEDVDAPAETDRTLELRVKTATGDINVRRA